MVSFYNGITPTKVAQQLIDQFEHFEDVVLEAQDRIISRANEYITRQSRELQLHSRIIQQTTVHRLKSETQRITIMQTDLTKNSKSLLHKDRKNMQSMASRISIGSSHRVLTAFERTHQLSKHLSLITSHQLIRSNSTLENLERIISMADPKNILKRGYSISTVNGKPIRDVSQIKVGDRVSTTLMDGTFESEVKEIKS
jgi:exodeoxyribonuclease VII large subunit